MKAVGIWLGAASAMALAACGQAKKPAAHAPAPVAAAPPAPATGAVGREGMAPLAPAAGSQSSGSAAVGGEAADARSAAASGRSGGRAFATQARPDGRQTPRRERSVEEGDDPDAQTPDLAWESLDGFQHRYSAAYRTCMGSAHGFTAEIADCYSAELARQGERLNRAYETAVAARSGDRKRRLVTAQRDWVRQRDSICQADDGPDLLHEGSCRLNLTIKRADELESRAG